MMTRLTIRTSLVYYMTIYNTNVQFRRYTR